jgi:hypothetical protein
VFAAEVLLTVIGWFAVSIPVALLIGGTVRLADARQPPMRRHLIRVI